MDSDTCTEVVLQIVCGITLPTSVIRKLIQSKVYQIAYANSFHEYLKYVPKTVKGSIFKNPLDAYKYEVNIIKHQTNLRVQRTVNWKC